MKVTHDREGDIIKIVFDEKAEKTGLKGQNVTNLRQFDFKDIINPRFDQGITAQEIIKAALKTETTA